MVDFQKSCPIGNFHIFQSAAGIVSEGKFKGFLQKQTDTEVLWHKKNGT
jgi:hypothetical protein